MHPDNVRCLTAAGIDVCALANNHVLDFGHAGLRETLDTLSRAGFGTAGAGGTLVEARAPAVVEVSGAGRLVVFAIRRRDERHSPELGRDERPTGHRLLARPVGGDGDARSGSGSGR